LISFFEGADGGGQSLREEAREKEKRKNEIYDLLDPSFYVHSQYWKFMTP